MQGLFGLTPMQTMLMGQTLGSSLSNIGKPPEEKGRQNGMNPLVMQMLMQKMQGQNLGLPGAPMPGMIGPQMPQQSMLQRIMQNWS